MEDLQLYSIREIIANERALKYVNCISFTEAVINSVRSGGYYKPERTPEIAERELYQLLINNETLTTDYNQAINAINEGRLVTFHVLEDLDFANYKYPKQPWLNISNHNGVIAPQELQIARIPTFEECRVIERETHTILARKEEHTDGVGVRLLANSLNIYLERGYPVVYATW